MRCFSHIAILVRDLDKAVDFYVGLFGMEVKWRNDEKAYLILSGHDSFALLRSVSHQPQPFDLSSITPDSEPTPNFYHFGPVVTTEVEFNELLGRVEGHGLVVTGPKTSRDGTRSFYFHDPEGYTVQVLLPPH